MSPADLAASPNAGCVFNGLARSSDARTVFDGSQNHDWWFQSVGSNREWHGGIPAFKGGDAQSVSLYVRKPTPPAIDLWAALSLSAAPELMLPPVSSWELALNIDTDDGNTVNYANADFWEDATALGGASSDEASALTQDYKNPDIFNSGMVDEVLVVVHDEGHMLGWRSWRATGNHYTLRDYFTASNTCEETAPELGASVQLAGETID